MAFCLIHISPALPLAIKTHLTTTIAQVVNLDLLIILVPEEIGAPIN